MNVCLGFYRCGFRIYRKFQKLFYGETTIKETVSASKIPWIWIGVQTKTNGTITVTDIVNDRIRYGDCVTEKLLAELTGYVNVEEWRYVDIETLDEKRFPSEGILIRK